MEGTWVLNTMLCILSPGQLTLGIKLLKLLKSLLFWVYCHSRPSLILINSNKLLHIKHTEQCLAHNKGSRTGS